MPRSPSRRGLECYFDILAEDRQKFHQPPDGQRRSSQAHEAGDLGLGGAKKCCGGHLCVFAGRDDAVNLRRELCLEQFLLGLLQADIGEHVAAAFFDGLLHHFGSLRREASASASFNLRRITSMSGFGVAMPLWRRIKFTMAIAEKDNPHGQVETEVKETVRHTGWHENDVASFDGLTSGSHFEM
jgi:hypothetical protein